MLPLPLPFHGHSHKHKRQRSKCTGELKVNTGLSASSYIVFNKTAEVNLKVAFGFGIRIQVIYLSAMIVMEDPEDGCSFPFTTLCQLQPQQTASRHALPSTASTGNAAVRRPFEKKSIVWKQPLKYMPHRLRVPYDTILSPRRLQKLLQFTAIQHHVFTPFKSSKQIITG